MLKCCWSSWGLLGLVLLWIGGCSGESKEPTAHELFDLGILQYSQNKFMECTATFKKLEVLMGSVEVVFRNLGACQERARLLQDAETTWNNCLSAFPSSQVCLVSLCSMYIAPPRKAVYTAQMIEICKKGVDLYPTDYIALHNYGQLLGKMFNCAEGVKYLTKSVKYDPTGTTATMHNLCTYLSECGYCEWALGNATKLVDMEYKSSYLIMLAIIRQYCVVSDPRSIEMKIASNNLRLKEFIDSGVSECKSWKFELDYPASYKRFTLPGAPPSGTPYSSNPKYINEDPSFQLISQFKEKVVHFVVLEDIYLDTNSVLFYNHDIDKEECVVYSGDYLWEMRVPEDFTEKMPALKFDEMIMSPLQQTMQNYYHSIAECIGRIVLLRKYLPNGKILLPHGDNFKIFREVAEILEIPEEVAVWAPGRWAGTGYSVMTNFHFKNIVVVDWRAEDIEDITDGWSIYFAPRWVIEEVSSTFLSKLGLPFVHHYPQPNWKILYLSREDTLTRKVVKEAAFIARLKEKFGVEHVEVFLGKNMPLKDQIRSFNSASVVVAPHGAGLGNLVWCREGTTFVYFPLKPMVDNCFSHLAAVKKLDFWVYPRVGTHLFQNYYLSPDIIEEVTSFIEKRLNEKGILNTQQTKTEL